ncbi:MAG: PH domain-containing protein [Chloroflexi bacterium]|nr:PH domain-containing protein [Chloroflexota bacterium]
MTAIDPLLGRGESIRYTGRQHVFVLISNVLTELVLVAVLIAAGAVSQAAFPNQVLAGMQVGVLVLLVCVTISLLVLGSAVLDYFRWSNEQYVITDQRVILLRGIFNIEAIDSSLEKINEVELRQSWLGRLFNFGDIEIITGSESGISRFRSLARPLDFKRAMNDARSDLKRSYAYLDQQALEAYLEREDRAPEAAVDDISHTLQRLAAMRDRGLISREEFEAKKRELLDRI